jgi:hypothetical protein
LSRLEPCDGQFVVRNVLSNVRELDTRTQCSAIEGEGDKNKKRKRRKRKKKRMRRKKKKKRSKRTNEK